MCIEQSGVDLFKIGSLRVSTPALFMLRLFAARCAIRHAQVFAPKNPTLLALILKIAD